MKKIILFAVICAILLCSCAPKDTGNAALDVPQNDEYEKELSDWQKAYAEFLAAEFPALDMPFLYINDINNCGVPELIIFGSIFYYSNGEIKGRWSSGARSYAMYLPVSNQIIISEYGINGSGRIAFYSFNEETADYSVVEAEYRRLNDGSYTLNGEETDITDEIFNEMLAEWRAVSYDYISLSLDDVGGDFTAYIEEKLFY